MTRGEAANWLTNIMADIGKAEHRDLWGYEQALSEIRDMLEYPEPQWIPCSERLPDKGVSVLISHVGYVSEDYLDVDDGDLYFWNSGLMLDEERENIAWMPLPEPWRGGQDE